MEEASVNWVKCAEGERFCFLRTVILTEQDHDGVYLIWSTYRNSALVVAQGNIRQDLEEYRENPKLLAYDGPREDSLYVTWVIESDERRRQGIAKFLTRIYGPVMSRTLPASGDTFHIPEVMVNLPD